MKYVFCFFIIFNFTLSAQIKGIVKDSITGKPIPYVGIWTNCSGISTSSDEKGKFKLEKNSKIEFIELFTTAYERKKLFIKDMGKEIMLLPKKSVEESNNVITNDFQKKVLDFNTSGEKRFKILSYVSTALIAQYIPYYESYNATPFLKSLMLDLVSTNNSIYKIRLFKADSFGNPSEEIVNEEIIYGSKKTILETIDPTKLKIKEEGQMIDLTKFKILFPKNGFFIAIEIMDLDDNKKVLTDKKQNEIEMLNPVLKISKISNSNTWKFENSNWIKKPDFGDFGINLILTN